MRGYFIRITVPEDAGRICEINKNSLGYDFSVGKTAEQIKRINKDEKTLLLSATDDENRAVGYIEAQVYDTPYAETYVNIMALAVDGKFQGKGLGKKLLSAAEDWGKSKGAVGIRLESSTYRTEAHKFYEACGYECAKEHKNFKKIFRDIC